jgi:hypothetical protein
MFRAKTKKSTSKKNTNVSGPITPGPAPIKVEAVVDVSGAVAPIIEAIKAPEIIPRNTTISNTETFFSALLDAESKSAVHKPWLRLERGLRMRLLRTYVEKRGDISAQERVDLLAALVEALDKKLLNSKSQITYNTDTGEIVEINALKIINPVNNKKVFRIEPPNRSTKKVRRQTSGSDSE